MGTGSFGNATLGDKRRTSRLVKVAEAVMKGSCCDGGGTLTSILADPHQAKAAYRLFDGPAVTHDAVLGGHRQWVGQQLAEPGTYLLIEDTTVAAFNSRTRAGGLGPIGESYTLGFWLHNTLAVRWEAGPDRCQVLGLQAQQSWARDPVARDRKTQSKKKKQTTFERQKDPDRESMRWGRSLGELPAATESARYIYVADRESDVYETFEKCKSAGVSYVIRASQPRALAGEFEGSDVFEAVAAAAVLGTVAVEIARENRTAELEVRSLTVTLRGPARPGGKLKDLTVNLVQAREANPPAGCAGVSWTLLTDLPVQTLLQCRQILNIYRHRWLVEELHKAMKTGLKLEDSQLSDARRLGALAAVISVAAVFLLQMKTAARTDGDTLLPEQQKQTPMVRILQKRYPPKGEPTRRWLWISVAKLGGFMARKGDGDPGWLILWRGWQTLRFLLEGYELQLE
jgi:hypothetical protein